MNPLQALATVIVSGVLALGVIVSLTVLLVSGVTVPGSYEYLLTVLVGVAIGGASQATK